MKPCDVSDGTEIITQGDNGDLFYVMTSGKAYVVVDGNQVWQ
jgi:CRP-like cAMP-binding protein